MSYHSQFPTSVAIHCDFVIGVWMQMSIRFSERLVSLDERTSEFLRTLAYLGGYCTVDQARKLDLANSPTRARKVKDVGGQWISTASRAVPARVPGHKVGDSHVGDRFDGPTGSPCRDCA